ncbi:MAG: hypothetical protein ACFCVK_08355, partial [Acidimicrobiales bacterium]
MAITRTPALTPSVQLASARHPSARHLPAQLLTGDRPAVADDRSRGGGLGGDRPPRGSLGGGAPGGGAAGGRAAASGQPSSGGDVALRGRGLRFVLVAELMARGEATVAELVQVVVGAGFDVAGRASKVISDALRWEVRRG